MVARWGGNPLSPQVGSEGPGALDGKSEGHRPPGKLKVPYGVKESTVLEFRMQGEIDVIKEEMRGNQCGCRDPWRWWVAGDKSRFIRVERR